MLLPVITLLLAISTPIASGRLLTGPSRSLLAVNTTAVTAALADVQAGDANSLAVVFTNLALENDTATLTSALTTIFYAGAPNNVFPNLTAQATHIANVRDAATIYALSTAYSNAFVALLGNGTTEAIGRATNAISEILLAKQPAFATAAFYSAFLNGLDTGAGQVAAQIIVDEFGACNVGTFLPAQYGLAVQQLIEAGNGTAAGMAVAAAALQGCCIAGAVNSALLQEILIQPMACQNPAVNQTFIVANDLTAAATGDPAALITALGKFGASSTVLACLEELTIERIVQGTTPTLLQAQLDARTSINATYNNLLAGSYAAAGAAITQYIATPSAARNATQQTVTAVAAVFGCQVVLPALQVALTANSTAFYQTFGSVMLINECLAQLTQAMGPGGALPAPVAQGTPIVVATTAAPTTAAPTTAAPTTTKAPTTPAPTTAAPTTTKAPTTPAPTTAAPTTTTAAPTTTKAATAAPTQAATTSTAAPTTTARTVAPLVTTSAAATVAPTTSSGSSTVNINTSAQAQAVANSNGSGSNGAGAVANTAAVANSNTVLNPGK